jgi:branched-chain amino acid transport system permease protein
VRAPARVFAVVLVVVAYALTWVLPDYRLGLISSALYLSVAVLSMNFLIGLSGQISIGHSAFVGVGAYTVAVLVEGQGWSYPAATVLAIVFSACLGFVTSMPSLRLKGLNVALASLGLALVFPTIVLALEPLTGGASGKYVTSELPNPFEASLASQQWVYLVLLTLTVVVFVLAANLKSSRMGRAMQAIRDHDVVAESFGVGIVYVRCSVFTLSAGMAGLAGAMFTIQNRYVSADDFTIAMSINLLVGMALGGATSIGGALLGGAFLQFVPPWTHEIGIEPALAPVLYGAILIACTIYFRQGLAGLVGQTVHAIRNAAARRASDRTHH